MVFKFNLHSNWKIQQKNKHLHLNENEKKKRIWYIIDWYKEWIYHASGKNMKRMLNVYLY